MTSINSPRIEITGSRFLFSYVFRIMRLGDVLIYELITTLFSICCCVYEIIHDNYNFFLCSVTNFINLSLSHAKSLLWRQTTDVSFKDRLAGNSKFT